MKRVLARLIVLILIATACITLPTILPEEIGVSSVAMAATVALNKTKATIVAGSTVKLKVTGTSKTPTWSSSNTKVAKVSSSGKVTGVKAGTAVITAKIGKKKYECTVKVKVTLNKTEASIYAGKKVQLKVIGTSKTATWSSSNTKVAKVSSTGKVTGVKAGTAVITAKIGSNKYKCTVKVKSPLSVDISELTFTTQVSKTVTCTYLLDGSVYVQVANKDIVTCEGGKWKGDKLPLTIYAWQPGTTTITISNSKTKDVKKIKVTVKTISGNIQGILGKPILSVRDRIADYLIYDSGSYLNLYFGVGVTGVLDKIDQIHVLSGSKYKLYGVYPGMSADTAINKLEDAGWSYSNYKTSGTEIHFFFYKGSQGILLSFNGSTEKVKSISLFQN